MGEAEKEASEVLHSLLSVERIEKPNRLQNIQHQVSNLLKYKLYILLLYPVYQSRPGLGPFGVRSSNL